MQTIKQNPEIKEAAEFLKEKWKWINEVRFAYHIEIENFIYMSLFLK